MIGETVSHYRILEKLGEGGMGVVYKAHDTKLKRTVALKFLPPELTQNPESKDRFIHEAQAVSALQHINICTVHDIDETDDGQLFIVMDCYDGELLKEKIARGPMKFEEAMSIGIQIAEGLSKAHDNGIVHRDIKPSNIIITNDGVVKIVDFGLAKLVGEARMTMIGMTAGTAAYMSPEQAQGSEVDHRTDIWSLGVVLFEILTGKFPFRGDHEAALMYAIVHEEPESLQKYLHEIPIELKVILNRALEKDREKRYQSVNDLIADMIKLKKELSSSFKPTLRKSFLRRNYRLVFVFSSIVLVGLAVVLFFLIKAPTNSANVILVLPFKTLGMAEDESFSDVFTEQMIEELTKKSDLSVLSRKSSMKLKGSDKDIKVIGSEVGAEYVLEAIVRTYDNNIRVSALLTCTVNDRCLWAESYLCDAQDNKHFQKDVCCAIAQEIESKLKPEKKNR